MDHDLFRQAERRLAGWDRVMLLSHARPDGDALGAMGAVQCVLGLAGRSATAFIYEDVPPRYRFLDQTCRFTKRASFSANEFDAQFNGIVILDTCSWSQLEPVAEFLRASSLPRIIVDHHATRDDLSGQGSDDLYVIDETSSSACTILHTWCEATRWKLDAAAADALFTGIATDTGWFRHSNTDAVSLRAAAALIEKGVRPDVLYSRLYGSHSLARVRLMAELLTTLEFHADGALATMSLTPEMFERTGASRAETEDLVNEPLSAEPVIVSILLTDTASGEIRASFRSKSPEVAGRDVDVAALAGQFGGGGHRRAAGTRISGSMSEARQRVTAAAIAALVG